MASELRWILLALSVLLLAGIWWWGVRRSRQARGVAHTREGQTRSAVLGPASISPVPEKCGDDAGPEEWGVPPFEPLSIHTADFDRIEILDLPMSATAEPPDVMLCEEIPPAPAAAPSAPPARVSVPTAAPPPDSAPAPVSAPIAAPAPAPAGAVVPNGSELQRIVTVRVCAPDDLHWSGSDLLAALEEHGLGYGRYKVFHRKHSDGRTLFCAASLVEPGTFDLSRMAQEEYRGLTLFAVLPGPAEPVATIDVLIATAAELAEALHGVVQDANGAPLSAQRAEALREDVARFQQSLSIS